eukprot:gnl/TRDRNA2_/TRDRNA2_181939_c0_seq1.p1 gnl/TRDRNA2_/TRDRNA2_181939_c0~~gnl/TRDRNA2_/TRDRNA2_181939_c0_seq1.p1  ORF type:complete len:335 (+),score=49.62 gnl/TRDRNA2_/TRDRNA2_181939_c0_seq1:143-1147(+)
MGIWDSLGLASSKEDDLLEEALRPPNVYLIVIVLIAAYTVISGLLSFEMSWQTLSWSVAIVLLQIAVVEYTGVPGTEHPAMRKYVQMGAVSMIIAFLVGMGNFYHYGAMYMNAIEGRQYENVPPEGPASLYQDAGTLLFTNVTLDDSRAVGLQTNRHTYCVAPVLNRFVQVEPGDIPPIVQFWAVGRDCCGRRQSFDCDASSLVNIHGGIVVHPTEELITSQWFTPRSHVDEYYHAIEASLALYGGATADPPVLLRWVASPEELLSIWLSRAMVVWVVFEVVNIVLVTVSACFVHQYYKREVVKAAIVHGRMHAAPDGSTAANGNGRRDPFLLP